MSRKSKGINAERELIHLFHSQEGWSAVRIAGSGVSKYPCPDVLAGNAIRRLAIECKTCSAKRLYLRDESVQQLHDFSQRFGAEAWLAVKFSKTEWYFLLPEDCERSGLCIVISRPLLERRGVLFNDLVEG